VFLSNSSICVFQHCSDRTLPACQSSLVDYLSLCLLQIIRIFTFYTPYATPQLSADPTQTFFLYDEAALRRFDFVLSAMASVRNSCTRMPPTCGCLLACPPPACLARQA